MATIKLVVLLGPKSARRCVHPTVWPSLRVLTENQFPAAAAHKEIALNRKEIKVNARSSTLLPAPDQDRAVCGQNGNKYGQGFALDRKALKIAGFHLLCEAKSRSGTARTDFYYI